MNFRSRKTKFRGFRQPIDPDTANTEEQEETCHLARYLEHGVVHRNITPRNLLIRTQDDTLKLNDLVLAKAITETSIEQITTPGSVLGDLVEMSPESQQ